MTILPENHEHLENLPAPMQMRVIELLSAFTGAMALPEQKVIEKVVENSPQPQLSPEVQELASRRESDHQGLSIEDARRMVEAA